MVKEEITLGDYDLEFEDHFKGDVLDEYLERGWFRMGAMIHTCDHFLKGKKKVPVYWLRYSIPHITLGKKAKKIERINGDFDVEIKPYKIDSQIKSLYLKYYQHCGLDMHPNLEASTNDPERIVYDTYVIKIRHGRKLIAAGLFDVGKNSVAGIKNIYHPDYCKYSLGKCLMILTYRFCKVNNIEWYYPGYVVPGKTKFDYKLFLDPGATEMYLYDAAQWIKYDPIIYQ